MSKPKEKPPDYRVRMAILFVISLIPGLFLSWFVNVDRAIVRQSAQNLIPVAGFLASAAIAMTFFYSGKLFDFISPVTPMVESFRQPIRTFVIDSLKKGLKPLIDWTDPNLGDAIAKVFQDHDKMKMVLEVLFKPFKQLDDMTDLVLKFILTSPREITRNGSISFGLLVASAFFSVFTMITGDVLVLAVSLGVLILGAGSLILGWFRAQDNLHGYLTGAYLLKIFGMVLDLDKPPGMQKP